MLVNEEVSFDHNGPLKVRLRMNASSANPSRGPWRWSAVQGDVPRSSAGADKYCRNKGQRGVLKYLRRKLLPPH